MNGKTSIQSPHNRYIQASAPNLLERLWGKIIGITLVALFTNSATAGQLTLTWNDNSDNEDGFRVERAIDGENFESIGSVEADVAIFLDATVVENQSYSYRVKAFNEYGDSGYTNTAIGSDGELTGAPTISSISDVSILEGSSTGSLAFTIGDAETSASVLAVSGSSSNQSLIPSGNISLGGSGGDRTVSLTPVTGQTGSATISIVVGDGTDTTTATFVLTVTTASLSEDQTISVSFSGLLGGVYESGQSDAFQILVSGAQSNIQNVQFFDNSSYVNTENVDPYDFTFNASGAGSHTLKVVVTTDLGVYEETVVVDVQLPPNTVPTISSIADVSVLEGGDSGTIFFSIGDTETNAADLTIVASSSNQSLLADSGIVLGGSDTDRSFDLNPVSGASGTSTVTITVSDGTSTTSESFTLTVQSITVPTISPIADVAILLGSSIDPIAFNIDDEETAADNLTLSLSSSNSGLLPTENISIEGTGANRTLNVTPVEALLGVTTVTVTVGDGSGDAIEAFEVAVQSSPAIRSQPVDTTEFIGGITALNVQVDAYPEPSYQWYFNGELIEGANEAELLFLELLRSHEGEYSVVVTNALGNVSSEKVQLTVDSLIQVIQSPINVTLQGEGTAILSVSAEGQNLHYQWYRGDSGDKSSPIEGATSSSYETDTLSADSKYWVEIKSGILEQSVDFYNSDTTTVFFQPIPRYFFGTFGSGGQGSFGLMAREDNTAVLLANIGSLGRVLETSDMVISAQGGFAYEEDGVVILSGTIDGDSVSGTVAGTDIVFQGTKSNSLGTTADFAGFYYAVIPNTSDGQVLVIAGPDGDSFVSTRLGTESGAGEAMIRASGVLESDIDERYALALEVDNSTASLGGTIMVAQASYSVDGQREDVQTENILFNTSIRGQVKGGSGTMIAGFVVSGSGTKKVLIRGLGPSLVSRGVANAVMDPRITLYRHGQSDPIGQNDNWADASNAADISVSAQLVGATPLGSSSKDASMLVELSGGVYTAHIANGDASEGVALVEVYDVSEAEGIDTGSSLANISMRGEVGTGNNVIIAGFVVTGDSPKRLLIRAMGPELQNFNVNGTLADPRLTIYKATNDGVVEIGGNDNWHQEADIVSNAAAQSGAFAFTEGSSSAGQVIWLDPGLYTAVVNSGDGSTGVALVEVYEIK